MPEFKPDDKIYVFVGERGRCSIVITDTDLREYDLAAGALAGSVFRMVRQGQRVVFDLDTDGRATALRLGSEADMETPA